MDNLFGKVCKCKKGKLGVVNNYSKTNGVWYGIALDGTRWQSKEPEVLYNSLNDLFDKITSQVGSFYW